MAEPAGKMDHSQRVAPRRALDAFPPELPIETGSGSAEQAAAQGRIADVAAFLDKARTIMQSEHAVWIGIGRTAPTVGKMKWS